MIDAESMRLKMKKVRALLKPTRKKAAAEDEFNLSQEQFKKSGPLLEIWQGTATRHNLTVEQSKGGQEN